MVRSALRVVPICYCDNFDGPLDTRGHVSAKEIGPTGTSGVCFSLLKWRCCSKLATESTPRPEVGSSHLPAFATHGIIGMASFIAQAPNPRCCHFSSLPRNRSGNLNSSGQHDNSIPLIPNPSQADQQAANGQPPYRSRLTPRAELLEQRLGLDSPKDMRPVRIRESRICQKGIVVKLQLDQNPKLQMDILGFGQVSETIWL